MWKSTSQVAKIICIGLFALALGALVGIPMGEFEPRRLILSAAVLSFLGLVFGMLSEWLDGNGFFRSALSVVLQITRGILICVGVFGAFNVIFVGALGYDRPGAVWQPLTLFATVTAVSWLLAWALGRWRKKRV